MRCDSVTTIMMQDLLNMVETPASTLEFQGPWVSQPMVFNADGCRELVRDSMAYVRYKNR